MTRKYVCPSCKEKTGVDIVYGMPSEQLAKQAELGEIALGGCEIAPNQPNFRCTACGFEWDKTRQFEEAKQRWLKEDVKGRSWVEMMDDKDKESDEKFAKLHTPEYIANWGKLKKDAED